MTDPRVALTSLSNALPADTSSGPTAFDYDDVTAVLDALLSGEWHMVRYERHGGLSSVEYDDDGRRLQRVTILEEWAPGGGS